MINTDRMSLLNSLSHFLSLRASQDDYSVFIADHLGNTDVLIKEVKQYAQRHVDAVILQLTVLAEDRREELLELLRNFPAVVLVQHEYVWESQLSGPVDVVDHSNEQSMQSLAKHLAAIGRHKVGFVVADTPVNQIKIRDFRQACRTVGLDVGLIDLNILNVYERHVERVGHSLNPHVPYVLSPVQIAIRFRF